MSDFPGLSHRIERAIADSDVGPTLADPSYLADEIVRAVVEFATGPAAILRIEQCGGEGASLLDHDILSTVRAALGEVPTDG